MNITIKKGEYYSHKASGTLELYRSDLINRAIRQKYPAPGYELAIMRKMIADPKSEPVIAEFNEYNAYVERCKSAVNAAFLDIELT